MRITSVGRPVFAATFIALGILGLVKGDITAIWQPVPKHFPAREVLPYFLAYASVLLGAGLLWRRETGAAARALFASLLIWMLRFKAPSVFLTSTVVSYESCGETAVLVAGTWVLYARFADNWDKKYLPFAVGDKGVYLARILYALALIAFGLSHFAYLKQTVALVPAWLPSPVTWAYFTGGTYIAAGAAVLIDVYARLAVALSALQMGLFTLLVWLPVVARGANASQWDELVISWTLTAGAWVVADSSREPQGPPVAQ